MMNSQDNDQNDTLLNELFRKSPIVPAVDFAQRTIGRIQNLNTDQKLEYLIDECLETLPVQPRKNFTEETLHRIKGDKTSILADILQFPQKFVRPIAAAAACILVTWLVLSPHVENQQTTTHSVPAIASTQMSLAPEAVDTTSIQLLSLLSGIHMSADVLLNEHSMDTLALLSYQ